MTRAEPQGAAGVGHRKHNSREEYLNDSDVCVHLTEVTHFTRLTWKGRYAGYTYEQRRPNMDKSCGGRAVTDT